MELHEVVEKLKQEGITPEEILKAIKQRRYILQKVKEYQKKTYKKVTVSIRKEELKKLKDKFPEVEEKTLLKILIIRKLMTNIQPEIFQSIWDEILSTQTSTLRDIKLQDLRSE